MANSVYDKRIQKKLRFIQPQVELKIHFMRVGGNGLVVLSSNEKAKILARTLLPDYDPKVENCPELKEINRLLSNPSANFPMVSRRGKNTEEAIAALIKLAVLEEIKTQLMYSIRKEEEENAKKWINNMRNSLVREYKNARNIICWTSPTYTMINICGALSAASRKISSGLLNAGWKAGEKSSKNKSIQTAVGVICAGLLLLPAIVTRLFFFAAQVLVAVFGFAVMIVEAAVRTPIYHAKKLFPGKPSSPEDKISRLSFFTPPQTDEKKKEGKEPSPESKEHLRASSDASPAGPPLDTIELR